jgi:hypothetical protein
MLTPMLPTVVSSWLDVLWIVDNSCYTQETVEHEKASSIAILDTFKPERLAPTSKPLSKAVQSFVLPIHPLNGTPTTHVSIVSRLKNTYLNQSPPLHLH